MCFISGLKESRSRVGGVRVLKEIFIGFEVKVLISGRRIWWFSPWPMMNCWHGIVRELLIGKLAMDIDGLAGGLALLWDDLVTVKIRKVEQYFTDADVKGQDDIWWHFTGFYGHPDTGQRHITWDILRSLVSGPSNRWVVIGAFNEILRLSEKFRGCIRNQSEMDAFRQALLDCNLDDMGAAGAAYTWVDSTTKERLDRAVCSLAWLASFAHSRVINVHPSRSNHLPLLLEVKKERAVHDKFKRDYCFEEMRVSHEGFSMAVEATWSIPQVGAPMV
ncbi:hypothetical protein ACLB2K_059618 [Fragaria x ananassa]